MSHDRGCPCGREKLEYNECPDPACIRRETKNDCKGNHTNRGINLNEEKRYVLIRENSDLPPVILDGQHELVNSFNSNLRKDSDQYYELGPEVKVETTIKVVLTKPATYRGG